MPVYDDTGTEVTTPHFVTGRVVLPDNPLPPTATVTLSGSAAFTSAASYVCTVQNLTGGIPPQLTINSGTSFTLVSGGSITITVGYICIGN